jgi:hypothetical protein
MIGAIREDLGFLVAPVLIAAYVFIFALVVVFVIRAARFFMFAGKYFKKADKEQKRMRIEVGKIGEEVHLLRQELKDASEQAGSAKPE